MKFHKLLEHMKQVNIRMSAIEGKLKIFDPDKKLNPELLSALKEHKPRLIQLIAEGRGFTQSDFKYATLESNKITKLQQQYPMLKNLYVSTPMQQGMLFHGMLDGSGESYTTQLSSDLLGKLNTDEFKKAWQQIVKRHDVYRTCFVGFEESLIHQLVQRQAELPFTELDWRDQDKQAQQQNLALLRKQDKQKGFDFAKAPLMRLHLIRLENDRYHLIWSQHHALTDGWCGPIIFSEVNELYSAGCMGRQANLTKPVPYENYIAWLTAQDKNRAQHFWKDHLASYERPTPLAIDRLSNKNKYQTGLTKLHLVLNKSIANKLSDFAKQNQCTVNVLLQAAWAYLLCRYSGENSVLFGSTISGRPADLQGVEDTIGLFINTVPVGVNFYESLTLNQLFGTLQNENSAREQFGYMSLTDIHDLSKIPNGQALFNSLIVFENFPVQQKINVELNSEQSFDIRMNHVEVDENTNYAITLGAIFDGELLIKIGYRPQQFSDQAIQRLYHHLENILCFMANLSDQSDAGEFKIMNIPFLTEQEIKRSSKGFYNYQSIDGKQTFTTQLPYDEQPIIDNKQYPEDLSLQQLFERQVQLSPYSTALIFEKQELNFTQLNQRVNQVAHYLIEQGVKAEVLVGLKVERSLEMVIAILAILKAGGAYLPLESGLPESRLQFIKQDAEINIVLTQQQLSSAQFEHYPVTDPAIQNFSLNDLAYVIYTSGSTGKPKGVMVEQANLLNFFAVFREQLKTLKVAEKSAWLWSSSYAFDASLRGLLSLFMGKTVILASQQQSRDANALARLLIEHKIQVFNAVPQLTELVIEQLELITTELNMEQSPISLIVGGEALTEEIKNKILLHNTRTSSKAINAYGPTEFTVNATFSVIQAEQPINIGQPVINTTALVLAEDLSLLPIGAIGELFVTGTSLARGYLNRQQQTSQRFISNPFDTAQTLYRTGDKASWMIDNDGHYYLNYLGRVDHQVKIRGYRIELGEIESQLKGLLSIAHCCVLVKLNKNKIKYLQAFVVAIEQVKDETLYIDHCIEQLRQQLPEPMVPTHFTILDELPLTVGRKIDVTALLAIEDENTLTNDYAEPRTELEQALCHLWQQVLDKKQIGIDDNFFDLGGTSILAMQLMALSIQQSIMFNPGQLFTQLTIRNLANELSPSELSPEDQTSTKPAGHHSIPSSLEEVLIPLNHSKSDINLFCLPPFGGLASSYSQLANNLSPVAKVFGLQAPDLFQQQSADSIKDLATVYINIIQQIQATGPYYLLGWSTGGALAYEVAHQLKTSDAPIGYLALLDSMPNQNKLKIQQQEISGKSTWYSKIKMLYKDSLKFDWSVLETHSTQHGWQILQAEFNRQSVMPEGISESMTNRYLHYISEFSQQLHTHESSITQLDFDLFKVAAISLPTESKKILFSHCYNWEELSTGKINIINIEGTHQTLIQSPHVNTLSQKLLDRLQTSNFANKNQTTTQAELAGASIK